MDKAQINAVLAFILIVALVLLWKQGYKKQVKKIILVLVIQAEKVWGSNTGVIKFAQVYSKLPTIITLLFSKQEITDLIEQGVEQMKIILENNISAKNLIEK